MTIITTAEQLIAAYADNTLKNKLARIHSVSLSDANLRGANLSDADLSGADLSGADLRGADLSGADLSDADLSDANLRGANLRGADLSGADLSDADLRDANLRGANLRDAHSLYSAFALHMSSRRDRLTGYIALRDEQIVLILEAGCWSGTPDEFRQRIADVRPNNGAQYLAAAAYIEACFNDDTANKRWDYLLT